MVINESKFGNLVILNIQGDIDIKHGLILTAKIDELIGRNELKILLDIEKVDYIDSSGIGSFINIIKKLRAMKSDMHVANASDKIKRTIRLTGLLGTFPLYTSREEAVNALGEIERKGTA